MASSDFLYLLWDNWFFLRLNKQIISRDFLNLSWQGNANVLSRDHVEWPGIDEVSKSSEKPFTENYSNIDSVPGQAPDLLKDDLFPMNPIREGLSGRVYSQWNCIYVRDIRQRQYHPRRIDDIHRVSLTPELWFRLPWWWP